MVPFSRLKNSCKIEEVIRPNPPKKKQEEYDDNDDEEEKQKKKSIPEDFSETNYNHMRD